VVLVIFLVEVGEIAAGLGDADGERDGLSAAEGLGGAKG